ncbi:MAG: TetR/AcrR family transcriptional regulator [Gemmatimonadetes bacterium]|nr:TetR/AcrR family transcriptional regulator [Gemmatimonadota bacterium]
MAPSTPASPPLPFERERDAARSREAILEAAEQLFAERGYDATSLSDVGQAAGVSRGTPGYFFGSKADLYRAVLEHCFAEATATIRIGRDRALASQESPDVILAGIVRDYFDFLAERPSYVKLMERNALGDGPPTDAELVRPIGQEALAAFMAELGVGRQRAREAAHLLLSLLSLCWFPVVHAGTYVTAVGLDPASRRFAEERRQHVIALILHGAAGVLGGKTTPRRERNAVSSTSKQ